MRSEDAQQRARERQRESRRRRRENANRCMRSSAEEGCTTEADSAYPVGVNRRLVRRDVATILSCVHRTLGGRGRQLPHKQAVMRGMWNSPITKEILPPETRRVGAETEARERIVSSLLQSLSEVKTSKTKAHLATKHAILTAVVTNGTGVCARQTARLLGIHHRNVAMATQRRASMLTEVHMQWTLSVRKTRSDATSLVVKDIIIAWWAAETRPSPNRKDVVRKWVAPKTYVEHHAQYLLESLVSVHISAHSSSTSIVPDAMSALMYTMFRDFFLCMNYSIMVLWVLGYDARILCCHSKLAFISMHECCRSPVDPVLKKPCWYEEGMFFFNSRNWSLSRCTSSFLNFKRLLISLYENFLCS